MIFNNVLILKVSEIHFKFTLNLTLNMFINYILLKGILKPV
jgi:hypothetical protein